MSQLTFLTDGFVVSVIKNKKSGGNNGNGFKKGDKNINRNGRPRKNATLFISKKDEQLYRKYRIRERDYKGMLFDQNGVCAICGQEEKMVQRRGKSYKKVKGSLAVDHCHKTGKVRGLLCWKCNVGIAKIFDDDEEKLKKAAEYFGYELIKK